MSSKIGFALGAEERHALKLGHQVVVPGIALPAFHRTNRDDTHCKEGFIALIGEDDDALRIVRHIGCSHGMGDFAGEGRHGKQTSQSERRKQQMKRLHVPSPIFS
ncbi:hypothetical protein [Devosia riboflavina]